MYVLEEPHDLHFVHTNKHLCLCQPYSPRGTSLVMRTDRPYRQCKPLSPCIPHQDHFNRIPIPGADITAVLIDTLCTIFFNPILFVSGEGCVSFPSGKKTRIRKDGSLFNSLDFISYIKVTPIQT